MKTETVLVTPEMARQLLASNQGNRRLIKSHQQFFEDQLRQGDFRLTHQGIAVSNDGRLLDGQHRLAAIAETGIAAYMLITYGAPEETFDVLDTGKPRLASDILSMEGIPHYRNAASSARLFLLYQAVPNAVWSNTNFRALITNSTIYEEYKQNADQWDACNAIATKHALRGLIIPSAFSCALYLAIAAGHPVEALYGLAVKLSSGADLPIGSPLLAYRKKWETAQGAVRAMRNTGQSRLADYIKLVNYYLRGNRLTVFKSQEFPPMPRIVNP